MSNKCNDIFDKLKKYMKNKSLHIDDMQRFCVKHGMMKNTFKIQCSMRTINNPHRVKLGKNRDDLYLNDKGLYEVYKNQNCEKYYYDKTLTAIRDDQKDLIKKFIDYFLQRYPKISHFWNKKNNILIITQCCATKLENKTNVVAKDLFQGNAHKIIKSYIKDIPVDWLILSAGYGLLNARESYIASYDDIFYDLYKNSLKKVKKYMKLEEDLGKMLNQKYDEVIFCIGDQFMHILDLEYLKKCAGDKCIFHIFLSKGKIDTKFKIQDDFEIIFTDKQLSHMFKSTLFTVKEKITGLYITHKNEYHNINDLINDVINGKLIIHNE